MSGAAGHPLELLSALLDGEISPAEGRELEAHLSGCGACRAILEDLRAVDGVLAGEEAPSAPGDLAARILLQAGGREPAPARRPLPAPRAFRLPMAAAAAMAGVLALWVAFIGMEGTDSPRELSPRPAIPSGAQAREQAAKPQTRPEERGVQRGTPPASGLALPPEDRGDAEERSGRSSRLRSEPSRELRMRAEKGGRPSPGVPALEESAAGREAASAPGKEPLPSPPPAAVKREPAPPPSGPAASTARGDPGPERKRTVALEGRAGAGAASEEGASPRTAAEGSEEADLPVRRTQAEDSLPDEPIDRRRKQAAREPDPARGLSGGVAGGSPNQMVHGLSPLGLGAETRAHASDLLLVRGASRISISRGRELTVAAPGYTCSMILPETAESEAGSVSEGTEKIVPRVESLFFWADRIGAGVGENACAPGQVRRSARPPKDGRVRKVPAGPTPEWIEECRRGLEQGRRGEDRLLLIRPAGSVVVLHPFPEGKDQDLSNLSLALVVALRDMAGEIYRADLEAACGALPEDLFH